MRSIYLDHLLKKAGGARDVTAVPEIFVACNFFFLYSKFHVSESGRFCQPSMEFGSQHKNYGLQTY
jgi:hypothetical protein